MLCTPKAYKHVTYTLLYVENNTIHRLNLKLYKFMFANISAFMGGGGTERKFIISLYFHVNIVKTRSIYLYDLEIKYNGSPKQS